MKKFISRVSLFTAFLIAISIYSFWIVEKYYHSGSGYSEVNLSFKHYILADSHANALIGNTEKFGVHHFAFGSDSYIDMKRKLSFLVKNTHVETIFITLSDQALSDYRMKANNHDRSIQFATSDIFDSYYEYAKIKIVERYVTLLNPKVRSLIRVYTQNLIAAAVERILPKESVKNENKNSSVNKIWIDHPDTVRSKRAENRFRTQFPSMSESEVLKNALKDIIKISASNDVRLIGIKYPMSNEFIELKDGLSFSGLEMFKNEGLEAYDFEKLYVDKQEKFQDSDHLNSAAGESFANILKRILHDTYSE